MKIKTIIADDEPLAREKIKLLLESYPDIELVKECEDGKSTVAAVKKLSPDLLFLDVQMPEMDGFAVLEQLSGTPLPGIIFVTAYDKYALRAFEVHALDYLLKPFDRDRFEKAVDRAIVQIKKETGSKVNDKLLALLEHLHDKENGEKPKYVERLVIKSVGRIAFLKVDEIDWIEAAGNYVRLHTGKESHLLRDTMNGIAGRLNPDEFVRIHRSLIVKIDCIKELQPEAHGEYILTLCNGKQVSSSRSYRAELNRLMAASS